LFRRPGPEAGGAETPSAKPTQRRRRLLVAAAFIVILAAGWFGLNRLRGSDFRWDVFFATFRMVDPVWFAASAALILSTYVVRAIRWAIMIRPLSPHPALWPIVSATCIGFTAITLFGRPGEIVRPWLIAARERLPVSSQLAAWLLERIYDLLAVLVIFGFALSRAPGDVSNFSPGVRWIFQTGGYVAAGIALACIGVLVMVNRFSEASRRRITDGLRFLPDRLHAKADGLIAAFTSGMSSTQSGRQVGLLLLWTLIDWALIAAGTIALFRSLPTTAGFGTIEAMMFLGFAAFGGAVQIPGIGGGTQVAAVLVLTELLGMNLEAATGVAILFWALGFVLIVPIGLALMVHDGIKLRSLRHLGEAETSPETVTEP
jgi:uncharacterized membrane protein YbhN (UPF0104 family)